MSKYTEAEVINAIRTMGLFRTNYPKKEIEKVVLDALEKQIPKTEFCDMGQGWSCPTCGALTGRHFAYCPECGQRLESDTE